MNEAQRDVALFRYSLIREAADSSLSTRQRGQLVRELAGQDHAGPHGRVRVARGTLDRWVRAYRADGFEALAPVARSGEPVRSVSLTLNLWFSGPVVDAFSARSRRESRMSCGARNSKR
jgi:putative transposase